MTSPEEELASLMNTLKGGYTTPTPGGDPIANPNTLPTGRNMYAINAEATPTESAWEKGIALAKQTIDTYKQRHNDSIPSGPPSSSKPGEQRLLKSFICLV